MQFRSAGVSLLFHGDRRNDRTALPFLAAAVPASGAASSLAAHGRDYVGVPDFRYLQLRGRQVCTSHQQFTAAHFFVSMKQNLISDLRLFHMQEAGELFAAGDQLHILEGDAARFDDRRGIDRSRNQDGQHHAQEHVHFAV